MLTFCMLECFALCLSGGTGAVDTRPTNQRVRQLLESACRPRTLFVALKERSLSGMALSMMSENSIAIHGSVQGEKFLSFVHWLPQG